MVRKSNKLEVQKFLSSFFPQYKITNDPFERFLCYFDKEVLGIISYSIIYERAEINYICVREEYRNQKIATKLLNNAVENILKESCENISLEVNVNNIPAINLYRKHNFKQKGIRKNYYDGIDGFLFVRELGDKNE